MSKSKITIVGLGLVGQAIGLSLSEGSRNYDLVGHDKEPKVASAARKRKAVDVTDWNLINACEGADVIILAVPVSAIRETLQVIAPYLKTGALLTDTASLKEPVLRWADEILPEHVSFVGGDPVFSAPNISTDEASAGMLKDALYCLCASVRAAPEAVRLAAGLVERLGAQPYFLDATEHDGLMAAVDHLPGVLAAALLNSTTGSASWRDMRRLAGSQYETSTQFASQTPATLSDACLHNQENLSRWIDLIVEDLLRWKETIRSGNGEALQSSIEEAMQARSRWLHQRASGQWDEIEKPSVSKPAGFFQSLFGFGGRGTA